MQTRSSSKSRYWRSAVVLSASTLALFAGFGAPARAVTYKFTGDIAAFTAAPVGSLGTLLWSQYLTDQPTGVSVAFADANGFAAVTGNTTGGGTMIASAGGQINRYFALGTVEYNLLFDAPATAKAKITMTASGNVSAWGSGYGVTDFYFGNNVDVIKVDPTTNLPSLRNFKWTRSIIVNGGQSVAVEMQAGAGLNSGLYAARGPGGGMAYIDPVLTIGGVPEPASWALMIAGFGLVGAMARRQRRQPAFAGRPISQRRDMMRILPVIVVTGLLAGTGSAEAAAFKFYNTGVAADGTLLSSNAVDPHYKIIGSPVFGPSAYIKTEADGFPIVPGVWLLDNTTSRYVVPSKTFLFTDVPGVTDLVTYRTTFSLKGFNPATAKLVGRVTSDDALLLLTLNGGPDVPRSYVFNSQWNPLAITTGFTAGINTLEFTTQSTIAPTGLRVELTGSADAVPEPASWAMMVAGFGLVGVMRRRSSAAHVLA